MKSMQEEGMRLIRAEGVEMAAKIILNLWPSMFMVSGGNILAEGSIPVIIRVISTELTNEAKIV